MFGIGHLINIAPLFWTDSSQKHVTEVLSRGKHILPFHIALPPDIPSSFEGPHGWIRYYLRYYSFPSFTKFAIFQRGWKQVVAIAVCVLLLLRSLPRLPIQIMPSMIWKPMKLVQEWPQNKAMIGMRSCSEQFYLLLEFSQNNWNFQVVLESYW